MNDDPLMGMIRDFLKQSTAEAHRKLDDSPLVLGLSNGSLSDDAYLAMLQAYLQFFSPWETAMKQDHAGIVDALGAHRFEKSAWLAEDIATLGGSTITPAPLDPPKDHPALLGTLYVVEGSTLGGMHLHRSQRGPVAKAGRFFQGYGEETIPAWKSFIDWLEAQALTEAEMQRAAQAAQKTFEWFQMKFDDTNRSLPSPLPTGNG